MTNKRDLKSLIRARMEKTGEGYASARRYVLAARSATTAETEPSADRPEILGALGEVESAPSAVTSPRASRWNGLIETTSKEAAALVQRALALEPRLTDNGLGVPDERRKRREARAAGRDVEASLAAELQAGRERLPLLLDEVAASADWIKRQHAIKSFNTKHNSYSYKHAVERWFTIRGSYVYVANGAFIAAAIGLGFRAKPCDFGSPNLLFNFSERTVSAVERGEVVQARTAARANPGRRGRRVSIAGIEHLLPPGAKVIESVPVENFREGGPSVYAQLYRWLIEEHGCQESRRDLHNRTFIGADLRERLDRLEKKRIRRRHPGATKQEVEKTATWSDLNTGPHDRVQGRRGTVRFEGMGCFVIPEELPNTDPMKASAWEDAVAESYFEREPLRESAQ